jgi:hypothetical protein
MVKMVQCVRRRPEVSLADFREQWSLYGEKIKAGSVALGAMRCTLSTTLAVKANLQTRGGEEPFDGVAEIWFESAPAAMEAAKRPEWQSGLRAFWAFQESFVDLKRSSFFWAIENEVFDWSTELG